MQEAARYYRAQAELCIQLAQQIPDHWVIVALHEMAASFMSAAARLDVVAPFPPEAGSSESAKD